MNKNKAGGALKFFVISGVMFALFIALIFAVLLIDVQAIGPQGSEIGLATLNGAVRDFFGVNMTWYDLTEAFGFIALAVVAAFGVIGFCQLIRRKSIKNVDMDILLLAVFYVSVLAAYALFEICVINRRPVLMEGELEASFPSSHTMLVVSIMGSTVYQIIKRIKNIPLCIALSVICADIALITALGRLACGVHWLTDIIGGVLLGGALIFLYIACCRIFSKRSKKDADKDATETE